MESLHKILLGLFYTYWECERGLTPITLTRILIDIGSWMSDIALYSRVDRVPVAAVGKTGSILLPSKVEPFIHHYECLEYNAVDLIPH